MAEGQSTTTSTDFLVCGACHRNFTLSSMQNFIQHKLFDCQGVPNKVMECQSCPDKFQTPWSLLQHAQNTHALKIFMEQGPYAAGISSTNVSTGCAKEYPKVIFREASSQTDRLDFQEETKDVIIPLSSVVKNHTEQTPYQDRATLSVAPSPLGPVFRSIGLQGTTSKSNIQSPSLVSKNSTGAIMSVAKTGTLAGTTAVLSIVSTPHTSEKSPVPKPADANNTLSVQARPKLEKAVHNLPKIVQLNDTGRPIISGRHSISVLQPIRLPKGAILSTPVQINNQALARMQASAVPVSVPLAQIRAAPATVQAITQKATCVTQDKSTKPQVLVTFAAQPVQNTNVVRALVSQPVIPAVSIAAAEERPLPQPTYLTPQTSEISSTVTTIRPAANPTSIQNISALSVNSDDLHGPDVKHIETESRSLNSQVSCCDVSVQADQLECPGEATEDGQETDNIERTENVEAELEKTEKDEDDTENTVRCCDNQDCGVTIMPGTHEGLKKCCNAVVPKKRKRHMETKHRIKKRATDPSFSLPEENTIYIDFQPGANIPRVSSATGVTLSAADSHGTITVNTSSAGSEEVTQNLENPSSFTLSIPVSYTRKPSCVPGKCGPPSQTGQECGCGCCPLKFQLLRDKKSKSARRLSTSSSESRKDSTGSGNPATNQIDKDSSEGDKNLIAAENNQDVRTTQLNTLGTRNKGRPISRAGVGKKRRYPTSRPFKCDQCDHAFNQRIHLKKHQSKHTGIKPFKCEQCDYSTVERSHLKVHIRVHTGEKPYKCSHCEYATAQNSTLKIHLKRHHGQGGAEAGEDGSGGSHTPFSCADCGKEFDEEQPYLEHQQDHQSASSSNLGTSNSSKPTIDDASVPAEEKS